MDFSFPTEVVEEGGVSVVAPKVEAQIREGRKYAPSRAPVFYNPVMELNRDLAVLALQAYQRMTGRRLLACEPFTGCGIRGIRFAAEVKGIEKLILGDINPRAVELARFNIERNGLANRVFVMEKDANTILGEHAAPRKRFDFIDVDPFGSPAPYLDSAVRALRSGGLLALTATDLAPLCGVYPRACVRKYGGKSLRTEYCQELAVRLLMGCLTMTAARHGIGVEFPFSHSTDHYIRVYARIQYGARKADRSVQEMGYVLHCFTCLHREAVKGVIPRLKWDCPQCGSSLSVAGPLWLGKVSDQAFCVSMEKEAAGRNLKQERSILKLLGLTRDEAEGPATYYVTDKICDQLGVPTPPLTAVLEELKKEGFQAVPTHFNSKGFKTDAPTWVVKEAITKLKD
ncbi:MAG: tRNA (guanine(10)-N(2))-dimethyltransferase [Candidatus Bathyarchaeia archaeon]